MFLTTAERQILLSHSRNKDYCQGYIYASELYNSGISYLSFKCKMADKCDINTYICLITETVVLIDSEIIYSN